MSVFSFCRIGAGQIAIGFILSLPIQSFAADVGFYGVIKGQALEQAAAGAPTPKGKPFRFQALVIPSSSGSVISASSQVLPNGVVRSMTADGATFAFQDKLTTLAALDSAYPNGSYRVVINTAHDGTKSVVLSLLGDAYPNDPHINNFTAAQAINPAASFTLRWDALVGGKSVDFIQVMIGDETGTLLLFGTPGPGQAGALQGNATAVVIPANTLAAGKVYPGLLLFAKVVSTDTLGYPGVPGVTAYFKQTDFVVSTTGTVDSIPPTLSSSNPANGASGVPVSSPVSFTFSEAMQPSYSITWSANIDPSKFSFAWSADQRTLTCTYGLALPSNATITWLLNPSNTGSGFRDLAGNQLAASVAGAFTTVDTSVVDVLNYSIQKQRNFNQSGTGAPLLATGMPFRFFTVVTPSANGAVIGATLKLPSGAEKALAFDASLAQFRFQELFANESALEAAYPVGTYTLTINTLHNGTKVLPLKLPTSGYPVAPHVSNFAATQSVDASIGLALTWDAFAGDPNKDSVTFTLLDSVGATVFPAAASPDAGDLPNTASSIQLPGGLLAPGLTYSGRLLFRERAALDTTSYPGSKGLVNFRTQTGFSLRTSAPVAPRLQVLPLTPEGKFQFRLIGEGSSSYVIEVSTELTGGTWTELATRAASQSTFDFIDNQSGGIPRRFYRARLKN